MHFTGFPLFAYILLIVGAVGHLILWVALVNRAHALGIQRRWVTLMTVACVVMFAIVPIALLAALLGALRPEPTLLSTLFYAAAWTYVVACAMLCVVAVAQRLLWRFHQERRGVLTSNHTAQTILANSPAEPLVAPGVATWLHRIPGNEILNVQVHEKRLVIPRLPPGHESLRIAHLSDLHMSGRMTGAFYERVVEETNRCQADIIAITGDIVDRHECLDWIPNILGRLSAPGGVFYVLGNHDCRVDQDRLQAALAKTDWVHVGGQALRVTIRGHDIFLGGTERPWCGTPTDFNAAHSHPASPAGLRIALSHSPDQIGWACDNDVDLMLAGHVHGGQVCLPVIGAFTAPSMHGVRYAAGTFRVANTILHVSRGTASLTPLRWNCPPEIAVLQLAGSASHALDRHANPTGP